MARPDHSRERLTAAAAVLLRQRGYAATSTTDVLRLAGATTGSLYHHFPGGKEDLAVAALGASADAVHASLEAALAAGPTVADALRAWLHGLRAGLEREYRDGCPIAPTALESAHAGERLRAAAAHAFGRWTGAIERALAAEGWPADEARRTAIAVLALGEGALLLSRTARDGEALTAVAEQVARLATRPA